MQWKSTKSVPNAQVAEGSQYAVPETHHLLFGSTHLKPRPLQMNGQNEQIDPSKKFHP